MPYSGERLIGPRLAEATTTLNFPIAMPLDRGENTVDVVRIDGITEFGLPDTNNTEVGRIYLTPSGSNILGITQGWYPIVTQGNRELVAKANTKFGAMNILWFVPTTWDSVGYAYIEVGNILVEYDDGSESTLETQGCVIEAIELY